MINDDSTNDVKEISYYKNQALKMIDIFNPEKDDLFYKWLNEFEYVINTIKVPENKIGELFITMVDDDIRYRMKKNHPLLNYSKVPYHVLLTLVLNLNITYKECFFHRCRFLRRDQYEKEPIQQYADNLRKIFNKCTYTNRQQNKICQRFLRGIRDDDIRSHISSSPKLSFDQMVAKATEFEKVNRITYYLQQASLKIQTYNPQKTGEFYVWLNEFEYVADIIKVPDDNLIEFFNEMVDNDVHTNVNKNYPSVNFSELSYEEIINHYLRYFDPSSEDKLHRKRYKCRDQYENETVEKYASNLLKIFNKCDCQFKLDVVLLIRFLDGVRDDGMKTYLKNCGLLTFNEAVATAIEYEKYNDLNHYLNMASQIICTYNLEYKGLFYAWLNEFEYTADILDIPDIKMVKFFNRMVNDSIHRSVKEAFPSVNFSALSYEKTVIHYLLYFDPSQKDNVHRTRFLHRKQYLQEPIEKYAYNLQKLFNKCTFKSHEQNKLCEIFLRGIRDDDTRSHISNSPTLSFDQMVVRAIEFNKFNPITYYLDKASLKIQTYNPQKTGEFYIWLNEFEYVADMIKVPDDLMVKFFIKMVDKDVHTSVNENYPSVNFSKLSYEEIIKHYLRYFDPCNENDLHRKRFKCRDQYEKETIAIYADNLQKIHNRCEEGSNFEEELCEKFINGILDKKIKKSLNNMPGLSFDGMVIMAIGFENEINSSKGNKKA